MENKYGPMVPNTSVNGARIELMEEVSSFTSTETSMMDSGQMIKPTVMEYISMSTEPNMRACGEMISSMEKASRP